MDKERKISFLEDIIFNYIKRGVEFNLLLNAFFDLLDRSSFESPIIQGFILEEDVDYFVVSDRGRLYRINVLFNLNGDFQFSTPEVIQVRKTTQKINILFKNRVDGKLEFIGVGAASVLNRSGEIDTKELFSNLVKRFNKPQPLNFYHQQHPMFRLGVIEKIFHEGSFLIIGGYIDESTELGKYIANALSSGNYGFSIEYWVYRYEIENIGGVDIYKFTDGLFAGAAILREDHAASLMTNINLI